MAHAPEIQLSRATPPKLPDRWPRRRLNPAQSAADRELLSSIQGNILRPHGRNQCRLVFFNFGPVAAENRAGLAAAAALVTSAHCQWRDARERKRALAAARPEPDAPFFSVALSAAGLQACGISQLPPGAGRPATAFAGGMAADKILLEDPPLEEWDDSFQRSIHGVWQVAANDDAVVEASVRKVRAWIGRCGGETVGLETCFHWRPEKGGPWECREPFGYADGISNPHFFDGLPENHWSVDISLDRVLIEDSGPHHGGSFLVLRKLDQNVAAYRAFEAKLAAAFRATATTESEAAQADELAESVIVGRNRAGVPLVEERGEGLNAFHFRTGDTDGAARCPFHAHIRKANPRDDNPYAEAIAMEDARHIQFVRRGLVYGDPKKLTLHGPDWPTGDVGLWFIAYMRDIEEQFREMQARWMRDRNFPSSNGDALPDPLLFGGGEKSATWAWARGDRKTCVPGLSRFVRLRGGEYFYVPTIKWLYEADKSPGGDVG